VAASRKKSALRELNKAASHLPHSLQLFGIHNGIADLARFRNRVIYERQQTKGLAFGTLRRDRGVSVLLSPAPRVLKGGGIFSLVGGMANRSGAVYTATGELVVSREKVYEFSPGEKLAQYPRLLPRVLAVDGPVAALAAREYNHFHWLFDALPKLHLLDCAGYEGVRLLVHPMGELQRGTLALLGIPDARIIDAQTYDFVRASDLIVPNYVDRVGACRVLEKTYDEYGCREVIIGNVEACVGVSEWICRFLRESFLDSLDRRASMPSRIYVSRADAKKTRGVREEGPFIEKISSYGFERVVLSDMDFKDQVSLFSHADVVIAPHGAGLANIVFCRPGTKCLELFSPSYVSDLYSVLSSILGVEYYYLVGGGQSEGHSVRSTDEFGIDATELERFFELAEVSES
jgi:capsular polysaccharide biosynthesis protein